MLKKILKFLAVFLAVILLSLVAAYFYFVYAPIPKEPKLSAVIQQSVINIGERQRSYLFYVPANLSPNAPLIFVLHGSLQDGQGMRISTGYEFERLADENGFAVVYPNGYEKNWNDCRKVASYPARTLNIDDKGFILALIEKFQTDYKINSKRVFATGYSNGGHFAFRLALEMPDRIAGFAAVAANLPTNDNNDCSESKQSIPAMVLNGTADPINPYDGGVVTLFGFGNRGTVLSASQTAAYFAQINGQTEKATDSQLPQQDKSDSTIVKKLSYQTPNRSEVILYTVEGGGHVVPQSVYDSSRILGRTSHNINAPVEIWSFFARQSETKF